MTTGDLDRQVEYELPECKAARFHLGVLWRQPSDTEKKQNKKIRLLKSNTIATKIVTNKLTFEILYYNC